MVFAGNWELTTGNYSIIPAEVCNRSTVAYSRFVFIVYVGYMYLLKIAQIS